MAAKPASQPSSSFPEYAVRRETISSYFTPPLPRSTFHDFVGKGVIIPMKGIRGFYLLNASLRRLGLREVAIPPSDRSSRSMEEIVRFAFSLIDPAVFPVPSWLLLVEKIEFTEANHALLIAEMHREAVSEFSDPLLKIAYLEGVLDGHIIFSTEGTWQTQESPPEHP